MPERLHVTNLGESGPRIAFLHGLFGQGKNWTQIAKGLAADYRPTLIDLPNHGQSGWTDELSYRAMMLAVVDELQQIDPDAPWTVLGHSMGGKVAMLLALEYPQLVERLVVVDMSPVDYGGITEFKGYVDGMRGMDLATVQSRADADALAQAWVRQPETRAFLLQNLRRTDDGWRWQVNLDLIARQLNVLGGWPADMIPANTTYDCPTLWVAGADSPYVKPEYSGVMRSYFPHVRLVTIKNAGHWPHSQQPQVFLSTIRAFLKATSGSA